MFVSGVCVCVLVSMFVSDVCIGGYVCEWCVCWWVSCEFSVCSGG